MTRFARSSLYLSVIAILVLLSQSIAVAQTSRPAVNAEVLAFAVAYRTNGESALASLTAEQKQQWAARIKSEFATSQIRTDQLAPLAACMVALGDTSISELVQPYLAAAGHVSAMSTSDVQSLATVMALCSETTGGQKSTCTALASELAVMVTTSQDWQSWQPETIVRLAGAARSADSASALRAQSAIAGYFKTHFLTDAAATKSIPVVVWSRFFNGTAAALSAEDKQLLVARVEEAYSKGITKASDKDAMEYIHVMETCNGEYAQATERIVNASDAWKSREPRQVADMVLLLRPDNSADSKSALTKLAQHVAGPMCTSDTTMRQVTLRQWAKVLKVVSPAIVENKADIATKLSAAFAPNHDAIVKLSSADVTDLTDAIASVDPSKVQPLAEEFLSQQGNLAKLTPADSVRLVTIASSTCEKAWSEALLGQLGTQWASQQEQSPLKWSDSRAIALVYLTAGQQQKAQEWATNAYQAGVGSEAARTDATLGTLDDIADVFVQAGLTGKGKGYPAFAQAIVSLIHKNVPVNIWIAERYSYMLGTPEALQIVKNEFADAKGNPNLVAARVTTWGHANQQDLPAWRNLLQEKYQASAATGDQKAIWLMIQAHALAVSTSTGVMYSPLAGKDYLEEALSAAQSQSVKLMVIEDLANGYAGVEDFDAAIQMIQSVDNQFADAVAKITLKNLSIQIQKTKQKSAEALAAFHASSEANSRAEWLAELRNRLAAAQQVGDTQKAQRIEEILSKNQDKK
jgi:hypothetical protein